MGKEMNNSVQQKLPTHYRKHDNFLCQLWVIRQKLANFCGLLIVDRSYWAVTSVGYCQPTKVILAYGGKWFSCSGIPDPKIVVGSLLLMTLMPNALLINLDWLDPLPCLFTRKHMSLCNLSEGCYVVIAGLASCSYIELYYFCDMVVVSDLNGTYYVPKNEMHDDVSLLHT
jgi:hypothetical protein